MPTHVITTFSYTASRQVFTVPWNVVPGSINVSLSSAGGANRGSFGFGGRGVRISCVLVVPSGTTLSVYVGGATPSVHLGGYNGGGNGGTSTGTGGHLAGGGGGASDIRLGGDELANRIGVAGGGGGAGWADDNAPASHGGWGAYPSGYRAGPTHVETTPAIDAWGGGGTQTAGGGRGISVTGATDNSTNGALATGGNGSFHTFHDINAGGGGGGGYYGGGGGGGSPYSYGGGGGGGSSYLDGTVFFLAGRLVETGASAGEHGEITFSYDLRDPLSGTEAWTTSGRLAVSGIKLYSQALSPHASAVMSTGPPSITHLSTRLLQASGKLVSDRGPELIFAHLGLPFTIGASLVMTGFRSFAGTVPLSALAHLTLRETLALLSAEARATLVLSGSPSSSSALLFNLLARLSPGGFVTTLAPLALAAHSVLTTAGKLTLVTPLTMAVKGSVSPSGQLSKSGGLLMYPQAALALSGRLTQSEEAMFSAVVAQLVSTHLIRHQTSLPITTLASLTTDQEILVLVGPNFAALAEMNIPHTELSNTLLMQALVQLIIENEPTSILFAPYLHVDGPPADMDFFVTSWPNRGDVRQVVKSV